MSCVNIKSKEFKDTTERLGISSATLETIVHSYQNSPATEGGFPSDKYILTKLGIGVRYQEDKSLARSVWADLYSKSKSYDTVEALNKAIEEAKKYFSAEHIYSYQSADGHYVMRVAQPVKSLTPKISLKKKDTWRERIHKEETRGLPKSVRDKVESLVSKYMDKSGIGDTHESIASTYFDGSPKTSLDIVNAIISNSKDAEVIELAKALKVAIGDRVVPISFDNVSTNTPRGQFLSDGTIVIYNNATKGTTEAEARASMERTMLHEIVHSITSQAIDKHPAIKDEIAEVMSEFLNYATSNNLTIGYALKNEHEFIAEFMSQPRFREALMHLKSKDKQSFGQRILNIIKRALGLKTNDTLYAKADKALKKLLETQAVGFYEGVTNEEEVITNSTPKARRQQFIHELYSNQARLPQSLTHQPMFTEDYFASSYERHASTHYAILVPEGMGRAEVRQWFKDQLGDKAQYSAFQLGSEVTYRDKYGVTRTKMYISFPNKRTIKEKYVAEETTAYNEYEKSYYDSLSQDEKLSQWALEQQELAEDRDWDWGSFLEEDIMSFEEVQRSIAEGKRQLLYMPKSDPRLHGNLAATQADGTIKVANDITLEDFWEYVSGTKEGVSQQKKEVFKKVMEVYPNLRDIITSKELATMMLKYHEMSHVMNNDRAYYPRVDGKFDIMNPLAIAIETRATLDGIERAMVESLRGLFEGGGMTIYDVYPSISDDLQMRLADHFLGDKALTRKDIEDTLNLLKNKREVPVHEQIAQFSRDHIAFDPVTHTYTIDGKVVDMSVTEYRDRNEAIEEEVGLNLGYLEVASLLGTTFDSIARDFLSGNIKTTYPNVSKEDLVKVHEGLKKFVAELDRTYGKGRYTLITDEAALRVAGQIEVNGEMKTIAGTMDLLLIDGEGKYHIYDFKTKRTNSSTEYDAHTLDKYGQQVSLYQDIIEANYPQLKGKFGGNHLVKLDLKYETPKGSRRSEYGNTEYRLLPNQQVGIFNGQATLPIQEVPNSGYEVATYAKTIEAPHQSTAKITAIKTQSNQQTMEKTTTTETTPNSLTKEAQAYLNEQTAFTKQIDNLLDSSVIQASEARHIAEQMVYWISDHITEMQEHPELVKTYYGIDLDINGKSRTEIVSAIGPDNIIAKAKDKFQSTKFSKRSTTKKARLVAENWGALMKLASDVFATVEDFTIVSSKDGSNEITTDIHADADNFNDSNSSEEVAENEGDIQEHWQIESRTIDVLASMSQLVRQALTKCYILEETGRDEEGNPTYDYKRSEFGINERVNARDATNSILRWTQGSLTLNDMITKLQDKAASEPWITQIISKLTDKSGKNSDFQSQFFGVFCKHFQPYSVVIKENGVYKSITVNELPALREAITSITTQFKIGEHPMFGVNGVNQEAFSHFKDTLNELLELRKQKFEEIDREKAIEDITYMSGLLGYYTTREMVAAALNEDSFKTMVDALSYMPKGIEKGINNSNYDPFAFKGDGSIGGNLRGFLQPLTDKLEDTAINSFYDSGKMYQSYVTPSYMTKLMQKFKLEGQEFDDFLQNEYGAYAWFKEDNGDIERGWRNEWLRRLATDDKARKIFAHKVQLNFNKHNYMRNMSDTEYALSLIAEYFSESASDKESEVPAWFRVPMLSNKPSSEFIKFFSYRGTNYKQSIVDGLKKIFDQELSRIQTVEMRNYDKKDPKFIKNFDKNGRKFMFLDFLNPYLNGTYKAAELTNPDGTKETIEVHKLLRKKLDGQELTSEEETQLNKTVKALIYSNMETRAKAILEEWKSQGIIDGAKQIANVGNDEAIITANLENFIWNDTFASMNIIQMTVTDIAYYKDAEDLQKRLAQIHAPGIRANGAAHDYEGKLVSDGYLRTFYLTDFDGFISNVKENVAVVFDRKIEAASVNEKAALKALKESILKQFDEINVADAQGYSSPTSYRKKAFLFGKWSKEAEEIYQKLKRGDYTYNDLKVVFQPLKPFVYSQIGKESGVDGSPMENLKVPVQNKNSEYLLIMADAILQGEYTGRANLLRAIYEVMEESADGDNTRGIDTVQFESTVKSGLMGRIDINQYQYAKNGEAMAKAIMKQAIYGQDGQYNDTFVHAIPVEDYCIQQEVPEHFKEHSQAHGSQTRFIIPSDLETRDYAGNPVYYEVEGRKLTAEQFKAEYESTIAENINESIVNLQEELGLNKIESPVERNIALSKILQREILSSPRYGVDLLQACSLDENGNFRIPLGDPIQSKRVEQLLNSIIKNRVNKQTIAGGPVVQVTNFGTSRELNIRFKDKEGKLLKTRKEFKGSDEEFKQYIKENQAGIAYFEVFAPIYTNSLFSMFSDGDGNINIDAIEALDPDLLKMIGYRIPTEDKYSIAPLKIVGFLPREAGDGIMLPNDITLLTGSDFDVDKEYLMRKEYGISRSKKSRKEIADILFKECLATQPNLSYEGKTKLREDINIFLDNPFRKGNSKRLLSSYVKKAFEVNRPTEGRTYRNNKIVDMTYEVLTQESTADKMLNPGGFDQQKRMGYMVAAFRNPANKYTWQQLQAMSIDELKDACYTDKNLSYIDTHIQFYKQNSAAGALIGIFAVNKVAHAVLEGDGYQLSVGDICGRDFTIAGTTFADRVTIDGKYDSNGQLIGKTLGSLVASAADAVKDPVLNLMNINGNTANILNTLVRLGMPFDDAALFLSQKVISDVLAQYNSENVTGFKRLGDVIQEKINAMNIGPDSQLNTEELTYEELVEGLKGNKTEIDYKVLKAFQDVQQLSNAMRGPTFATRFNSISSAVGPLIIDNLIIEHKMAQFSEFIFDSQGNQADLNSILQQHPILREFAKTVNLASTLFGNMPANCSGFRNILASTVGNPICDILYGDRRLLSSLSDFYQSYLLLASGVVNNEDLNTYIKDFPTEFFKANMKEKYPDNLFVQAIKLDVNKNTGRAVLKIDTTGLDTQQKEVLSSGWIDFHKTEPELSTKLFIYNFFRSGIGFSPKTFMGLVPTYVKERIKGYTDTFRVLPSVSPELVLNQFIRNNWDNSRLVPKKSKIQLVDRGEGIKAVVNEAQIREMAKVPFFRMKVDNRDVLYQQISSEETQVLYREIQPLGNNKEYLEISLSDIINAANIPATVRESNDTSNIKEQELDAPYEQQLTPQELAAQAAEAYNIMSRGYESLGASEEFSNLSKNKAKLREEVTSFMTSRFRELNQEYNQKLVDEVIKKFC